MSTSPDYADALRHRIRVALLHEWDPIGIRPFPEAQGEYDSYVPDVCHLLLSYAPEEEILNYLWRLETQHMGLRGDRQRTEGFASRLIQIRDEVLRSG